MPELISHGRNYNIKKSFLFNSTPLEPIKPVKHPNKSRENFQSAIDRSLDGSPEPVDINIIGICKLFDPNYHRSGKLLWFIVLMVMTGICCWQLWIATCRYFSYPIIKDVSIERRATVRTPAVYLCPIFYRLIYHRLAEVLLRFECFWNTKQCIDDAYERSVVDIVIQHVLSSGNIEKLWTRTTRPDFPGMIFPSDVNAFVPCHTEVINDCSEDGQQLRDLQTIQEVTFWGRCVMLNTSAETLFRGLFTSLTVVVKNRLHDEVMEKLTSDKSAEHELNQLRLGLLVGFHPAFAANRQHEIYFSTQELINGYASNIEIRITEFTKLNLPGKPCKDAEEVSDCLFNCINRMFDEVNVTCRFPYTPSDKRICNVNDNLTHIAIANYRILSQFTNNSCNCPRKCKEIVYATKVNVIDKLNNSSNVQFKLIFTDSTCEINAEGYAYNFEAYLSDVGGTMGFFIGFCLLSILETLEILRYLFQKLCKK